LKFLPAIPARNGEREVSTIAQTSPSFTASMAAD
jgi:hypothetical protein